VIVARVVSKMRAPAFAAPSSQRSVRQSRNNFRGGKNEPVGCIVLRLRDNICAFLPGLLAV
jgi:hypothetical protein